MAAIITKRGQQILVDDEDFEALDAYLWHVSGDGYARRSTSRKDGPKRHIRMHRQILGLALKDGQQVDHVNGDPLDNRKANLRICSTAQNAWNVGMARNNTSGFKGASYHRRYEKFVAQIAYQGKRKHLGYFNTAELAHEMYCLAADMLHGEFANHGAIQA